MDSKTYYRLNKQKINEYQRQHYHMNKEKYKQYFRRYYQLHKKEIIDRVAERQNEEKELRKLPYPEEKYCEDCGRMYMFDIHSVRHRFGCRYTKNYKKCQNGTRPILVRGTFTICL